METKKSLTDKCFTFNPEQWRSIHFALCEHALEKWNSYAKTKNKIKYVETVAGTEQEADKQLPSDSFTSAMRGLDLLEVAQRYEEPIIALQDEDLTFPENITFAYYAIYNLFKKYVKKEMVDDWLIANQALSTEDDSEAREILLNDTIQSVKA
jgi:hypothetical protein